MALLYEINLALFVAICFATKISFVLGNYEANEYNVHSLANSIKYCLGNSDISQCFKKKMLRNLDAAINDNATWYLNEHFSIEKDKNWNSSSSSLNYHDLSNVVLTKVLDLVESRSLKFRISPFEKTEGRKKKYKGGKGGYAMMGGMAIMGMIAQLVIGKLLLLAGGAFILAKIALLYSILSGFKKSGGSNTDHVIYAESGGNSPSHSSGWHRSNPRYATYDPYSSQYHEEENHDF